MHSRLKCSCSCPTNLSSFTDQIPSYPQLLQLALSYRFRYNWDQKAILSRTSPAPGPYNWFKVQDIAVNCVYASGWSILADLADTFDTSLAAQCRTHAGHAMHGILTTLVDPETGDFVTGYINAKNEQCYHPVKTIQMLFPLLLPSLPSHHLTRILSLLASPSEFGAAFPIPSVSRAEPSYNPIQDTDLLWRGPGWGFTNWFLMEGLTVQGKADVRDGLVERWIEGVRRGGVWENWNPETGIGYGAEGLGMSCLVVDWIRRLRRVEERVG